MRLCPSFLDFPHWTAHSCPAIPPFPSTQIVTQTHTHTELLNRKVNLGAGNPRPGGSSTTLSSATLVQTYLNLSGCPLSPLSMGVTLSALPPL